MISGAPDIWISEHTISISICNSVISNPIGNKYQYDQYLSWLTAKLATFGDGYRIGETDMFGADREPLMVKLVYEAQQILICAKDTTNE